MSISGLFLGLVLFAAQQDSNSLHKLKQEEQLTLYFTSFGCFHRDGKKLVFTNTGSGIEARLYQGRILYPANGGRPSMEEEKQLVSKILSEEETEQFTEFEKEMSRRRDGGCTTSETYTMVSPYKTLAVTDASCDWFGFTGLIQGYFGELAGGGVSVNPLP